MGTNGSKLAKFFKEPLKTTFDIFGENPNSAIYVAVAIAAFKGFFRPIFTMRDKKSDPQTKKYTAIREALTELIAIPIYFVVPKVGSKLVIKHFHQNAPAVTKKAVETNVKFLGVLISTALIPAICNVIQPPIMGYLKKDKKEKQAINNDNNIPTVAPVSQPAFSANPLPMNKSSRVNYGMRVGS